MRYHLKINMFFWQLVAIISFSILDSYCKTCSTSGLKLISSQDMQKHQQMQSLPSFFDLCSTPRAAVCCLHYSVCPSAGDTCLHLSCFHTRNNDSVWSWLSLCGNSESCRLVCGHCLSGIAGSDSPSLSTISDKTLTNLRGCCLWEENKCRARARSIRETFTVTVRFWAHLLDWSQEFRNTENNTLSGIAKILLKCCFKVFVTVSGINFCWGNTFFKCKDLHVKYHQVKCWLMVRHFSLHLNVPVRINKQYFNN